MLFPLSAKHCRSRCVSLIHIQVISYFIELWIKVHMIAKLYLSMKPVTPPATEAHNVVAADLQVIKVMAFM